MIFIIYEIILQVIELGNTYVPFYLSTFFHSVSQIDPSRHEINNYIIYFLNKNS